MVPAVMPIPRSLPVERLFLDADGLTILASSAADAAVRRRVQVRTVLCDTAACLRRIFSERLGDVAVVSARRTTRQGERLTTIAFALGRESQAPTVPLVPGVPLVR